MFVNRSGQNEQYYQRTFHRCFPPSFGSFGQTDSEEKNLKNQSIRNKNCLWWPCLLTDGDGMSNLYRGPSIDASYPDSDHLAKRFQRFFRNRPIRNKSHLWRPCLSMDRDEMSTLYRGPPIDVSVHLTKRFQRRRILKISQSETSRLWWPCLLTDRDEMSNFYRGPSIDVSYQVSVHLAKRFQRRRF
jgi:hypothetical protein